MFNGVTALQAQRAGFKALYLSGSGVAGAMAIPDLGITTMSEVVEDARRIVSVTSVPLIADIDTGFGEVLNVARTVRAMESVGVAAVHMEDQEMPKKCGHLSGKRLVGEEDMVKKVRAAVEARHDDDFVIIARTDARAVEGFDGAVRRGRLYIEAGADMVFPEALESEDEFGMYAKEVKAPLLANMTEFGKSPLIAAGRLGAMGYRIVIFPLTAFRASLKTTGSIYEGIMRTGSQTGMMDRLMTREDFYKLIGYHDYEREDVKLDEYDTRKKARKE